MREQQNQTTKNRENKRPKSRIKGYKVESYIKEILSDEWHSKQVLSLARGTLGVVHAAALGIHAIGRALAIAQGLQAKHAIKQVDRLLSNQKLCMQTFFQDWVTYIIGERSEAWIALDWTSFHKDKHQMLAAYLVSTHGRATPLMWKSFQDTELADGGRTDAEDTLLLKIRDCLPDNLSVTLLADRGFADQKLCEMLKQWSWSYVIRLRAGTYVNHKGESKPVQQWLMASGRARKLDGASLTQQACPIGAVVTTRQPKMKDAWYLASNLSGTATQIIKCYARRFTIEETFRDQKDPRFGLGMSHVRIQNTARRDRLFLLAALAQTLLTLLGAAGERAGMDKSLKANTAKKRTISLFRQGCFWFEAIPNMPKDRLKSLMFAFAEIIDEHYALKYALGVL